ncbi:hypothetical protein ABK040_014087 [Willaertia magna]
MSQSIIATVVIPAYKEAANLKELITRIYEAIDTYDFGSECKKVDRKSLEVIVVDDNSQDGSEEIVNEISKTNSNVRIIVRKNEKGLSSAVLRGFDEAKATNVLLCMDADLQHPPESVPRMLQPLLKNNDNTEFVLGTRYGSGSMSVDSNWPLYRRVISKTARSMARPLTPLSDPMSGFFAITTEAYRRARSSVNPIGFKIALELYVKASIKKHSEVPFAFGVRLHGYSKLSGKVIVHYLKHLYDLYLFCYPYLPIVLLLFVILFVYLMYTLLF